MAPKKELKTVADPDAVQLTKSLAEVRAKIEGLKELEASLADRLMAAVGNESAKVGELEVVVKAGSRSLDAAALAAKFPAKDRPELYVTETKLDVKAVREHFAPAQLVPFLKEPGKSSVTLK